MVSSKADASKLIVNRTSYDVFSIETVWMYPWMICVLNWASGLTVASNLYATRIVYADF